VVFYHGFTDGSDRIRLDPMNGRQTQSLGSVFARDAEDVTATWTDQVPVASVSDSVSDPKVHLSDQ